jgi:hypothetical protein
MDTFVLRILQDQVAFQCKAASIAALQVNESLLTQDTEGTFVSLQNLLVAAANLSKLFWGSSGRKEELRAPLRDSLAVANDSPLRDPDLRNDFEHFDERVELWFGTSEHRNFLGRMIGNPALVVGMATGDRFQQFDPLTAIATFWDHSVELNRVMAEVNRILPLAQAEARKPHWDESPAPELPT